VIGGVVVDTSAAFAVLGGEDGAEGIIEVMDRAEHRLMSAATVVELGIVMEARLGPAGALAAERFLRDGDVAIVEVDRVQADRALDGWRRFGKGRHPAALNLGDCFTYALAAERGDRVLCTGDDFTRTDLRVVSERNPADVAQDPTP
jgi:ribonuclease VapC